MSWVTAVPRCDDVFDEDLDELSVQNKEWTCNMERRTKDGFRDGIDAGKEASLQQGFNLGYREGAAKMKAIGQFKGIISAVRCWCQSQPSMRSDPITQLLQKVEKHEESLFEAMRKAQEMPPPGVSELVGDMDDLAVDQSYCGGSDYSRIDQDGESCRKGHNDCCIHDKDISANYAGIHTKSLFIKGESMEQLFHKFMELVTEMGLPEELKLHIQQFRHLCI
ncbi:OTU deubiquitinase with linear linkage specificity a [Silurus meridionalis]|uniref:OTU deubiquitinase with linear linkage specificity a n=1 Tax=Silurus meridionalis TaxID=175797 RepID=UPI001EEA370A|nr:OTU deubiquitinase with linear linkage specificity a [Silurus meridionalis]KAI5092208.1 yae1 domain-containing protein 1 [Silurus meridionalis]